MIEKPLFNQEVSSTDNTGEKEINGETVSGRDISFEVEGPSCNTGTSEYVEFFTWVDEDGLDLEILNPTPETEDYLILPEPTMPEVTLEAQLHNYSGGEVQFNWEYDIEYALSRYNDKDNLCDRTGIATFTGTSTAQNSERATWQLPFEEENAELNYIGMTKNCSDNRDSWDGNGDIIIGGQTTVKVTVETSDGRTYTDMIAANNILGGNPSVSEVKAGLTLEELVIVYHESLPKWRHFNLNYSNMTYNRKGMPVYGYPNGFGLFQIDTPPATEEELWNWRANKQAGKALIEEKKYFAANHLDDHDSPSQDEHELFWKETFQLYNGGFYWKWEADDLKEPNNGGQWVDRFPDKETYGEKVWKTYQAVKNGTPPAEWGD